MLNRFFSLNERFGYREQDSCDRHIFFVSGPSLGLVLFFFWFTVMCPPVPRYPRGGVGEFFGGRRRAPFNAYFT